MFLKLGENTDAKALEAVIIIFFSNIAPQKEAQEIIFQAKKAKIRELIVLRGVDHRFKTIDGVEKEKVLISYIFNLIKNRVKFESGQKS